MSEVEVVEVQADFTGQPDFTNDPQPLTIEQLILAANADVIEYIAVLQRRINELEA